MSSPDLQNAHSGIQSIFSFAEVQKRLNALCNRLASAQFYPSTGETIKKELQAWNTYDATIHSSIDNISFVKGVVTTFKSSLRADMEQARRDIDAINCARRKKKHGMRKLLSFGAALSFVSLPMGLATIGTAVASGHGGGGDVGSLERMVDANRGFISELEAISRLYCFVCDYQWGELGVVDHWMVPSSIHSRSRSIPHRRDDHPFHLRNRP